MDDNNNDFIRPCVCGSVTHRTERSKLCKYYVPNIKNQVLIDSISTENINKDEAEKQQF